MPDRINNITSAAVSKATGKTWVQWLRFIDRRGGAELDHKQIVALLRDEGGVDSGWWQQTVTVGYEHARGRRRTGETADAGFQVEGDPTEGALITAANKAGYTANALLKEMPRIDAIPFESEYMYMATLHHQGEDRPPIVYIKGSLESILSPS